MGRFLKTIGWIILIPILAILLFFVVKDDTGQVLITGSFPIIGPKTIHTTIVGGLLLAAVSILIIYVVIRLIITIIRTPKIMRHFRLNRRARIADKQFAEAELALLENRPKVAEDLFLLAAKGSKSKNLCYVGAARAAQLSGNMEKRDRYLREIDLSDSKHDRELAEVQRAELLLEADENEKAELLLNTLLEREKNHYATLLLAVALQKQGKNEALFRLLPNLQKALPRLTPSEEIDQYTENVYKALFEYASQISKDSDQLRLVWGRLPKHLQHEPALLIAYANRLLDVGDTKRAEEILRKEINRSHNEMLILAYGHLYRGDQQKLLHHAKKFNADVPDSAITQYTLAHMLFRNQQYDEAMTHLQKTIQLDPQFVKAYRLIGEIKLIQNDDKSALEFFKEAMALAFDERPKDVKRVDGDLLISSVDKISHKKGDEEIADGEFSNAKENVNKGDQQEKASTTQEEGINASHESEDLGEQDPHINNNYDPRRHL